MGRRAARFGDAISHGGAIVQGSPDTEINGRPAARRGDGVVCAVHGGQAIAGGSSDTEINGRPAARIGDAITCGAVISSGSPDTEIN